MWSPGRVPSCRYAVVVSAVLLLASDLTRADDYPGTVLAQGPVGYWRLNETNLPPPQPILATNLGSLGESADGALLNGVIRGQPGVLAGNPVSSDRFTNENWTVTTIGGYVNVPYTNAFNPNGPFTVEFWAKPRTMPVADVFSPLCSLNTQLG